MAEAASLSGRRVLIVEDEYLIAEELREVLEEAGAIVIGPAPSVARAIALVRAEPSIDGAVLDLNLNGEMVFPVADALSERGAPFLFTTGYHQPALPERYAGIARCEKPVDAVELKRVLLREIVR